MKWKFIMLVMVLIFSVSSVRANQGDINDYFERARGGLLGFYNSEIVSHAGIILGLFVAFSTIASRWTSFFRKNHLLRHEITFCLLLGLILSLTTYSIARLVYWSSLGINIMDATPLKLNQTLGVTFDESNVTSIIIHLNSYSRQRFWIQNTAILDVVRLFQPDDFMCLSVLLGLTGLIPFFLWLIWRLAKRQSDSSGNIEEKESKTLLPWRTRENRILEYQELNRSIWNRGHHRLILQSILISGSLLAVSYVARNISEMNVLIARIVLCGSLSMIAVAYVFHCTTERVNSVFWQRVNKLEELIGIEVGNRGIYNEIKDQAWFKLRRFVWNCIFVLLAIFYIIALIWTFY